MSNSEIGNIIQAQQISKRQTRASKTVRPLQQSASTGQVRGQVSN